MNVLAAYNDLNKLCNDVVTVDKNMTTDDIDELISILIFFRKLSYQDIKTLRQKIRNEYTEMFPRDEQIKMHMKWAMVNNDYDDFRDIIITNLSDNSIYKNIMHAIEKDKLHFSIDDIKQMPNEFIDYCTKNFTDCKEIYDDDDETTPKCTNAELFLVNCLLVDNKTDILAKIGKVSMPCLRVLPVKCIVFEGEDLLDQIYSYYKTKELSPLIGAKRNLVVLEGNKKNEAYDYAENKNTYFYSTEFCAMTLEFPYLCYVYPKTVSLNVEVVKNVKLNAYTGIDVIQLQNLKPSLNGICKNVEKQTCTITSAGPCTYIGFSIGFSSFAKVGCPQVSGRAVVLV
jgi:hypothetical protein